MSDPKTCFLNTLSFLVGWVEHQTSLVFQGPLDFDLQGPGRSRHVFDPKKCSLSPPAKLGESQETCADADRAEEAAREA